ncbi:PIF1-like helicase-domain-containing protein [Lactarius akahatsu]|uniref:ATP-dependent DNA helicase n=1 Tax=Lactarius akahatsu TaxID=416441 RepID=A0AAD4LPC2_9AGAM|nr:PIF1-like helicase-domain-containing protein [Lactarius akahatsu]
MARTKKSYYAVKKGRDGPKVYDSWEECRMTVTRYSRAEFRKFRSLADAEAWILPALMSLRPPADQSAQESTQPISAEVGPLNVATSCGEDTTGADTTGDAATIRPAVVLTEEQINVLEKTVLLREIIHFLKSTRRRVAITASTGIASINIGGTTLHSWAGIGLGEGTAENLSGKIRGTERLRKRWWEVDSLIIDEISMISAGLFDKLEEIARTVRSRKDEDPNEDPFGGIQVKSDPP